MINIIWSKRLRFFHWSNAFLVLTLIGLGMAIGGYTSLIGIDLTDGFKESIIPFHIGAGILMALGLAYRIKYMISPSDRGESFAEVNPLSKENLEQMKKMSSEESGHKYKYHNPIGRLMIAAWFVVLSSQAITGIVLSYEHLLGEDGIQIISTANAHGNEHESTPTEKEEDGAILEIHELSTFLIMLMIFAHIAGVIKESIRAKSNLTKKMITGLDD